ncbi:hypothetical protein PsorP6_009392 [Peronosclerospora sorghi]|uniref:Uncharacterized protein n=1 Tax=Peronosclerospora sorghi TaxID=230839 RepID=A0ACC0VXH9_9STRA|nr:hypothetical protein PsorP6_009392 [Peronosclerospora sorghi]
MARPPPGRAPRSGSSWSGPMETPDATTRTLAFDSVSSNTRVKKRRRRAAASGAFRTDDTRRLDSELDDEIKTENVEQDNRISGQDTGPDRLTMWSLNASEDAAKHASVAKTNTEKRKRPPWRSRKTMGRSDMPTNHVDPMKHMIERLRSLVRKCSEQHHAAAALFYADKLVSMSSQNPEDVLLFANACYINREFHRAMHAVKKAKLVDVQDLTGSGVDGPSQLTLRAALLLGKCMLATKKKDECLELLGAVLPEREDHVVVLAKKVQQTNAADEGINIVSSLALLMGEAFEASGNRENAIVYYRTALRCDVHCFEAFSHLFDKQLLSAQEEQELMASLDFSTDDMHLLELLYSTHLGKYNSSSSVDEKFRTVEAQFGLADNLDLVAELTHVGDKQQNVTKAETYYDRHDIQQAHKICQAVREQDPFNSRVITVYVGTLVELGKKRELYHYAHQLVDVYPTKASAWYTVGCYYLLIQKYEAAQRYFHKATSLEPSYAPAWIAFGNAFAAQDESDQAMSSYRTASILFPGSHLPLLYIGMEYLRTNNLVQAQEFLKQASGLCPTDPLIYNELGSVFYKQKDFVPAIEMFSKALELCQGLPEVRRARCGRTTSLTSGFFGSSD